MAVLAHRGDLDGDGAGHWYVEAKFGLLERLDHPTNVDLDRAQESIRQRLAREHWAALPPGEGAMPPASGGPRADAQGTNG